MAAHQYWRLSFPKISSWYFAGGSYSDNLLGAAEIVFYDSTNAVISTSGGTASASSQWSSTFSAAKAFDGNPATYWVMGAAFSPSYPGWIQMKFASAVSVDHITVQSVASGGSETQNGTFDGPVFFSLQYSDNGTSFTTVNTWQGAAWTSFNQTQTFTPANAYPPSPGIIWRLNITAPTNQLISIGEWNLFDAYGNPIATTSNAADAASELCFEGSPNALMLAFDGSCNDACTMSNFNSPSGPGSCWLSYAFPNIQQVGKICLVSPSLSNISGVASPAADMPTAFTLVYSLDQGSTWVTAGTYTASWTSGTGCQNSCFTVSPAQPPTKWIFQFASS